MEGEKMSRKRRPRNRDDGVNIFVKGQSDPFKVFPDKKGGDKKNQ